MYILNDRKTERKRFILLKFSKINAKRASFFRDIYLAKWKPGTLILMHIRYLNISADKI